jgi:peptidoglycan/xylan/chitin deacetylase (PgdA/CDA1 family)
MKQLRDVVIRTGLEALYFSGAHHLLRPMFAGIGTIFMLHHVRPRRDSPFQPNRHLEVTPEFLRMTLAHVRSLGIDIVTADEMHRRLSERDFALPVMREYDAPLTVYVANDFADWAGRIWWITLERIIAVADRIDSTIGDTSIRLDTRTVENKQAAFIQIHDLLRALPDDRDIAPAINDLCARHGVDEAAISRELCLSWDELKPFAADPLVTIGAHTVSHCNLAKRSEQQALQEIAASRTRIETVLQRPVAHLAYPYGDRRAAGPREFAFASGTGFKTAVTTRPGMIFPENAGHPTALPRISLNGNYQTARVLPVLTSGAATAMWNGFRRVDAT